ncbi:MAG: VPLPA-CTERM-specific exosortase XrtD [Pseudomonadota bacterium]
MSSTTLNMPSFVVRDRTLMVVFAALLLAFGVLFHAGIANLWYRWGFQQELSHSYFIPLITIWMLWDRREAIMQSVGRSSTLALPLLAFAVFMVFALKQLNVFLLEHIGMMAFFVAMPLLIGGVSLLRVTIIPIAYLAFMIPPPFWVITVTSWNFQLWSSELGVAMIRLFDVPVLLEGNVIELGNITLQVVEACSGLRYLFPFLSLGALAGYFYRGPLWQRLIVVLSTIPITIVMNSFRIAITGVLSDRYGSSHTEGFLHFFEGWVVFLFCIALLLGLLVVIARLSGKKDVLKTLGLPFVDPVAAQQAFDRDWFIKIGGGTAAALLVLGPLVHTVDSSLEIPERQRYAELPLEFSGWQVQPRPLDVETEKVLAADDYIVMDVVNPEGETFNLYTAYLEQQRNGSSWHSPQQCLPGGGWKVVRNDIVQTPEGSPAYFYNRMVIKKGDARFLVHYWYQQRGRRIANEFVMKGALIWDVLTRRRSDGAMIRLMTPVGVDENVLDAEERMQRFHRRIEDTVDPYIPV